MTIFYHVQKRCDKTYRSKNGFAYHIENGHIKKDDHHTVENNLRDYSYLIVIEGL